MSSRLSPCWKIKAAWKITSGAVKLPSASSSLTRWRRSDRAPVIVFIQVYRLMDDYCVLSDRPQTFHGVPGSSNTSSHFLIVHTFISEILSPFRGSLVYSLADSYIWNGMKIASLDALVCIKGGNFHFRDSVQIDLDSWDQSKPELGCLSYKSEWNS